MRSRVPARKVCAMGSTGIRTRVKRPFGRARRSAARYVGTGSSTVDAADSVRSLLRRKPEVTYSSCVSPGRTSVTVTWRSVTGAVERSMRFRLAGPTMVVALVKAGVSNAMPLAAGTVVQS